MPGDGLSCYGGGNDIATIIAQLGGNAQVPAFYDSRYKVTTAAGPVVSQWDDARGSTGFGPSLIATGTSRPPWDATNTLIGPFDGIDDEMVAGVNAAFALNGACAVFLVASIPSTASIRYPLIVANALSATSRLLGFRQAAGAGGTVLGESNNGTTLQTADSTIVVSATRRLWVASKNATTTVAIDVPNHAEVTAVGGAIAAGTNAFTLGDYFAGDGENSKISVRACGFLAFQPNTTQLAALTTWAQTYHGITPA